MIFLKEMAGNGSFVLKVFSNEESVAEAAAGIFVEQFKKAMTRSEKFSVVLSGGNTPTLTYELLAREPFQSQINWRHVHVFWGDERCVPITDLCSNSKRAYEALLSHVPIPPHQIHPIPYTRDPNKSAVEYELVLKKYFDKAPPFFNLVLLGLGKDGHTASLFPGSTALTEKERWVVGLKNTSEEFGRVTLTLQILNLTRMTIFLVTGQEKAKILEEVLSDTESSQSLPARLIHPVNGELIWLVDSTAHPTNRIIVQGR